MNCRFCNKPLKETDEVCPECGLKVQEEGVTPQPEQDWETENQNPAIRRGSSQSSAVRYW